MKRTLLLLAGVLALCRFLWTSPPPYRAADSAAHDTHYIVRMIVRHPWLSLAGVMLAILVGGAVVVVSGIVPIKASAGHWAVTRWFLEFSMSRSISTHSAFIDAPPLDDPAQVLKGAGHYELGCRPCHGAPGTGPPRVAAYMTPHPPALQTRIPHWDAEELFYIVKHGIKLTGMPAWPAQQRDDEVWAMVAFLQRLPGLDQRGYTALIRGDITTMADLAPEPEARQSQIESVAGEMCARCHGVGGTGRREGAFPKLAGQRALYLENSLRAYATGERYSGVMGPIAAALPSDRIQALSRYYADLGGSSSAWAADTIPPVLSNATATALGETIATRGLADRMIPACVECHGPTSSPRNSAYPILSGQYREYLVLQLELLRERRRGGSAYVHLMHKFVDRLTPEYIRAAASYYASLDGDHTLGR